MRKALILTAFGATLLGVGIGWWAAPVWRQRQALAGIASADANQRQDAWRWLNASITHEPERTADLLGRIDDVVRSRDLSDAAVIDAANALRQYDHWGWTVQPAALILRESSARLMSENLGDQLLGLELLQSCPLDADSDTAWPLFVQLMETGQNSRIRALALEAACGWLGRERAYFFDAQMSTEDIEVARKRILALSWRIAGRRARQWDGSVTELDLIEAMLLHDVRLWPDDTARVVAALRQRPRAELDAAAIILRAGLDAHARDFIDELEAAGDSTPWLLRNPDRLRNELYGDIQQGLERDPIEPSASVYAAALLAERRHSREDAIKLAESWIRDFNDDRKRAGSLLSALLGEHADLLQQAYDAEDVAEVRLAQRMALYALDEPVGPEDPREFAYRLLAAENGDFDPDIAICLLIRGDQRALRRLTSRPVGETREQYLASVLMRDLLIERFIPEWRAEVGAAAPGSVRAANLHFDLLESLRWLTQRRLGFDRATRTFETP